MKRYTNSSLRTGALDFSDFWHEERGGFNFKITSVNPSFLILQLSIYFAAFYLVLRHFSMQILTLEIHSFKPLWYTFECSN